jgi:hypothetical protein
LYQQPRNIKDIHGLNPPNTKLVKTAIGYSASIRLLACLGVSLFEGIGLQGLLSPSSRMELGRRWLSMVMGSKFTQTQKVTRGVLRRIEEYEGAADTGIPNAGADIAVIIPNAVSGTTIVLRSLKVKSQIDFR